MEMTNCPNCGAVITGAVCEYCGTRFDIEARERRNLPEIMVYDSEQLYNLLHDERFVRAKLMEPESVTDGVVGMIDGKIIKVK